MAAPQGRLAENILYFARALRSAGIPVGPGAVLDALEALSVARVGMRDDFYWTLHAVFVKRHEHTVLFDQAFRIFFRKRGYIEKLIASMLPETMSGAPKVPPPGAQRILLPLPFEKPLDLRVLVIEDARVGREESRHSRYLSRSSASKSAPARSPRFWLPPSRIKFVSSTFFFSLIRSSKRCCSVSSRGNGCSRSLAAYLVQRSRVSASSVSSLAFAEIPGGLGREDFAEREGLLVQILVELLFLFLDLLFCAL